MQYNFKKLFDNKQIKVDELVKWVTINNNTGYITLRVSQLEDVLSSYCIPGYEYLNSEFKDVLSKYNEYIPSHFPMVLEITGCDFTDDEKKRIQNAIWHEYEYDYLSEVKEVKRVARRSVLGVAVALFFLAYLVFGNPSSIIVDLVWIPLWTVLDPIVDLFWGVIPNFREMKRRLVQCQTMKIVYTNEVYYTDISQEKISQIHEEILANALNEEA